MSQNIADLPRRNDLPASLAHYPYIAALPPTAELSTPLWFTSSERDLLTGTNLRGAIEGRENEWKEEAAAVRSTLRIEGLSWYVAVLPFVQPS